MRQKDLKKRLKKDSKKIKNNVFITFCKNWYYGSANSKEAWLVYLLTPVITFLLTKYILCN